MPALDWDIFCRVIDNHGDLGVCWRLATDLATRGHGVRLWIDDPSALAWMAPQGHPGVQWLPWREDHLPAPRDVVIEAFGCDPPADFVRGMAARPPVWINLEYLSAEAYVARSHGLRSPVMSGPGAGLSKWFFYPGFTADTGGLLREPGLIDALDAADPAAALAELGVSRRPGEQVLSLFCYDDAPVQTLAAWLAGAPTLLLTTPGHASRLANQADWPAGVRCQALPWLSQPGYDRLLAACDLNLVRGEDSFVRAQWAGRPFLWHIYPQHDGVHADKLDAFLDRLLAPEPAVLAAPLRAAFHAWNRLPGAGCPQLPGLGDWGALVGRWRDRLLSQADLASQLLAFVLEKR